MKKMMDMGVNSNIILWIKSFLTNRKQYVQFKDTCSPIIITNTGAPQGCVLSALLFTLYTFDCKNFNDKCLVIKYADDTIIVGLIDRKDDVSDTKNYINSIDQFNVWCEENFLNLNVKKTKEMHFDFSRNEHHITPVKIDNEKVEIVTEYKYLGFTVDHKLTGTCHVKKMIKKANQRMFFLRKLKHISVDRNIMDLFYKSVIQSVFCYCMVCWFVNLSDKDKKIINKVVKCARRMGVDASSAVELCNDLYHKKIISILDYPDHPLYHMYKYLPSSRLDSIYCRTERFKKSFVPTSIRKFNNSVVEKLNIK